MKSLDLETLESQHQGLKGLFERSLRRFKTLMHVALMLPIYLVACLTLSTCLIPGIYLFRTLQEATSASTAWIQNISFAFSLGAGFFLYGFSLIFLAPTLNFILRASLKEWRGPYYSVESLKWFIHNGLTYLVRFTFLEFVTPSPLGVLFYKMMGMKIGRGAMINSTWISDPSLIELGDRVTIGGSVTLVAHYGQGGLLIVAPVKIGHGCTIGLKATIMGGSVIGDGAKILPHSVILPKTQVPAGETWGGVPAAKMNSEKKVPEPNLKIA